MASSPVADVEDDEYAKLIERMNPPRDGNKGCVWDWRWSSRSSRSNGIGVDESKPQVAALDCCEKDYSVIILRSKDRPKLLSDTVCTLTDMQYVVFHGTVDTGNGEAYQEYYIRHVDEHPLSSEAERQRVI